MQLGLFGPVGAGAEARVAPAPVDDAVARLAAALPRGLRLGTSSWTFPGWRGVVYARNAAARLLAQHGLAAYAQHPLLTAVGLDRTYYAPLAAADFGAYAAAVPAGFRFVVKAWSEVTSPTTRDRPGLNPRWLDAEAAIDHVIAPAIDGLGDRLGALVFQFPPQGAGLTRRPTAFADRLGGFLGQLPRGPAYAVELRDAALVTRAYADALARAGARHCFSVHPRMPPLARQRELVPLDGPVTARWMLGAGLGYEEAKARYEPFDRLVDPDPGTREGLAALCRDALGLGHDVVVTVNNKAEGSAPHSVVALARAIAAAGS